MFINNEWVQYINAVAGYSSATDVGGDAPLPSGLAESGLTLFHNEYLGFIWSNPYAWYFSIGNVYAYQSANLNYVELAVGQSHSTINGLNYALSYINP
ncbi:hypothetical protein D1869_06340 [Sulfurisphaera ohwakuensis]|nr:hypothetical protein D1869_06340 [Sulfurisphaera ohwakuensis]